MHIDDKCSVSQREIGLDTGSFTSALRAALRQDPDVIQVGEIRDGETMEIAAAGGGDGAPGPLDLAHPGRRADDEPHHRARGAQLR
jgi:hypothetical protein